MRDELEAGNQRHDNPHTRQTATGTTDFSAGFLPDSTAHVRVLWLFRSARLQAMAATTRA